MLCKHLPPIISPRACLPSCCLGVRKESQTKRGCLRRKEEAGGGGGGSDPALHGLWSQHVLQASPSTLRRCAWLQVRVVRVPSQGVSRDVSLQPERLIRWGSLRNSSAELLQVKWHSWGPAGNSVAGKGQRWWAGLSLNPRNRHHIHLSSPFPRVLTLQSQSSPALNRLPRQTEKMDHVLAPKSMFSVDFHCFKIYCSLNCFPFWIALSGLRILQKSFPPYLPLRWLQRPGFSWCLQWPEWLLVILCIPPPPMGVFSKISHLIEGLCSSLVCWPLCRTGLSKWFILEHCSEVVNSTKTC